MAYNRINLLTRMIKIQDITLDHTRRGVTQKWVFDNIIHPGFCISEKTFQDYLSTNAKAELKKLRDGKRNCNEPGKLQSDKTGTGQSEK